MKNIQDFLDIQYVDTGKKGNECFPSQKKSELSMIDTKGIKEGNILL